LIILGVEYQFDSQRLTVYFSSSASPRFCSLAAHLGVKYQCRVWMHDVRRKDHLSPQFAYDYAPRDRSITPEALYKSAMSHLTSLVVGGVLPESFLRERPHRDARTLSSPPTRSDESESPSTSESDDDNFPPSHRGTLHPAKPSVTQPTQPPTAAAAVAVSVPLWRRRGSVGGDGNRADRTYSGSKTGTMAANNGDEGGHNETAIAGTQNRRNRWLARVREERMMQAWRPSEEHVNVTAEFNVLK
jgi:hypothetical protein